MLVLERPSSEVKESGVCASAFHHRRHPNNIHRQFFFIGPRLKSDSLILICFTNLCAALPRPRPEPPRPAALLVREQPGWRKLLICRRGGRQVVRICAARLRFFCAKSPKVFHPIIAEITFFSYNFALRLLSYQECDRRFRFSTPSGKRQSLFLMPLFSRTGSKRFFLHSGQTARRKGAAAPAPSKVRSRSKDKKIRGKRVSAM